MAGAGSAEGKKWIGAKKVKRMKGRGPWLSSMLNKHLSYKHPHAFKEVVNIRTAGAA